MSKIGQELLDEIDKETQKVTFSLFRDLVFASPVGNPDLWQSPPPPNYVGGNFRANWQLLTSDNQSEIDGAGINASTTLAKAKSNLKNGATTYYIVNNAPYGPRLNDGWSQQAPKKFVEKAVKRNTD